MSATKTADHKFLNEQMLLVRNDKIPKINKSFDNITFNFEPTDDSISLSNKKENSLWLLNDRISQRAERPATDFITKSNYDPERDELLKEYNKEYPSSFEYIDENGEKKYRKFLLPEFEVELKDEIPFLPNKNLKRRIDYVKSRLEIDEADLINLDKAIEKVKLNLSYKKLTKQQASDKIERFEKIKKEKKDTIDKNYRIFQNLIRAEDLEKQREKDIQTKNAHINEENKANIKAYRDTLNLLNKGQFNTQQEQGESDEDYLTRLRNNAEIEEPANKVEDMVFLTNSRFRKNMKTLIRSNTIIEQLINSLNNLDKLEINKRFVLFKKEFEKVYGVNNNSINIQDILNFITKVLPEKKPETKEQETETEIEQSPETTVIEGKKAPFEYNFNGTDYYVYVAVKPNTSIATYKILISKTGTKGSFNEVRTGDVIHSKELTDLYTDFAEYLSLDKYKFSQKDLAKAIIKYYPLCELDYEDTIKKGQNKPVGYGIESDISNVKYGQLGRYKVNLQSLYHKNFFKLYSANGDKVGKKGVTVSDLFVRLICQLVEGKRPSQDDISLLPSNELHLFNWMIQLCGLKSKHSPASLKYTINELKNRLQLLEGEIKIGNDNPEILKEIINILHHLKDFGVITPKKIKQYLSQFEIY